MIRRCTAGLVGALLLAALGLAGCGVPTSSGVEYVGPGPEAGSGSRGEGQAPPSADDATTPHEQVTNFLQAAAGSPDGAADRVRPFIRDADQAQWAPEESIRVVRLRQEPFVTDEADGSWRVELTVQPVGDLRPGGYLDAVTGGRSSYEFRVVTEGGGIDGNGRNNPPRLRIANPPDALLLADTALTNEDYFYPTPIYFWDTNHDQLVPDLRWLPLAGQSADGHPLIVVRWLLGGPAPALSRLLKGMPGGSQLVGTPEWQDGDRLVVNFNATAIEGQTVEELGSQLAWSLLPLRPGADLELRIDNQQQDFVLRSPTWPVQPVRMAVLDGVIRQLADADAGPRDLPVLSEEINSGVLSAALTRDGELAALVREDEAGGQRLSVAHTDNGSDPVEEPTGLVATEIGQPVWLSSGGSGVGLVVADGSLHRFTVAGSDVDELAVSSLAGAVTAVAVAPERRRLALIAGDELYVAWLDRDGESVTIQDPRPLPTSLQSLAGVAFSHENELVVAGEKDNRVGLYAMTVDGGLEEPIRDLSNASVTSLVAHPYEDSTDLEAIMYEANGQAFTLTGAPSRISPEDLDAPEDVETPPLAPFFLD